MAVSGGLVRNPNASPRRRIAEGLGMLSEDRKEEGLALDQSIEDNLTYTRLRPYNWLGCLNIGRRRRAVEEWLDRLRVRCAGPGQAVGDLSGGNQQKVALGRLLHQDAEVLLLDEPTRGVDVGSKAEIYRLIGDAGGARQGGVVRQQLFAGVARRLRPAGRDDARPTQRGAAGERMDAGTGHGGGDGGLIEASAMSDEQRTASGRREPADGCASQQLDAASAGSRRPLALPAEIGPLLGLVGVFVLFLILLAWRGQVRNFLSLSNLQLLMHQNAIIAIVVLGALFVIISGGIDLSVGSVAALAAVATALAYNYTLAATGSEQWASVAAVVAGVGAGGLCGLANGLTISWLRITPFVVTLGMLSIARGLAVLAVGSQPGAADRCAAGVG